MKPKLSLMADDNIAKSNLHLQFRNHHLEPYCSTFLLMRNCKKLKLDLNVLV